MSKESTASGGIGFTGLLAIVFITLKLTKVIAWSWWWVLAPLWVPPFFFLSLAIGVALAWTVWRFICFLSGNKL